MFRGSTEEEMLMRRDRRDFLKATAGVYAATALGAARGEAAPTRPDDLTALSLIDAAELLRARKVSPVELTNACLARIERLNHTLNAFITVTADGAVAQAREAEAENSKGTMARAASRRSGGPERHHRHRGRPHDRCERAVQGSRAGR
jgi:hypothetical protein